MEREFYMFLTKECDYALRIIRVLSNGEKATAEQICDAEAIPGQFAYKILKKLERAGWIMSSRGRDGGYWLVSSPDKLTIFDVVSAVDENMFINECLRSDRSCLRNTEKQPCAVHKELVRIQELLVMELSKNNLSKIISGD